VSHNVTMFHASPETIWDRLLELAKNDRLRYGDFIKLKEEYHLTDREYHNLRLKFWRYSHGIVSKSYARAYNRIPDESKKPQSFNAHGRLYYQTLVLNDDYIVRLPLRKNNRWGSPFWFGIVHKDFTLMAFPSGLVIVYQHEISWRESMCQELSKCWDQQAISSFDKCLQVNGSKLELAVAIPGVPAGQHYSDKSGLIDIDTDHTPKQGGNVEIKVNIGEFDRRLSSMEKLMEQKLSGVASGFIYTQLFGEMAQIRSKINELNELIQLNGQHLNTADLIRTPPNGASPGGASVQALDNSSPPYVHNGSQNAGNGHTLPAEAPGKGDPTAKEQMAQDLGLAFREGYRQTSLVAEGRPETPAATIPDHCPYLERGYGDALLCMSNHVVFSDGSWKEDFESLCFVVGAWEQCSFFVKYRQMGWFK
jgi:hypothetical protein